MVVFGVWIMLFATRLDFKVIEAVHLSPKVYVSKYRNSEKGNKQCGSKDFPCKTLAEGFQVLSPGGHLIVDGEGTKHDPYDCQSNSGKLLIQRGFTMMSYMDKAYVSCSKGITVEFKTTYEMVNVSGIVFVKTNIRLLDAPAVFNYCTFTISQSSSAIKVNLLFGLPSGIQESTYYMVIKNSTFYKNRGIIQVYSEAGSKWNGTQMKIQDSLFDSNQVRAGSKLKGLISIDHSPCTRKGLVSIFWKNVSLINNSIKGKYGNEKYQGHGNSDYSICSEGYTTKCREPIYHPPSKSHSDPVKTSFLVVNAYATEMTFIETKSSRNEHMRFLGIRSCQSSTHFHNCSFRGHSIYGSGGVLYVPEGRQIDVSFHNTDFFRNQAYIGAVLQIDNGTYKVAKLTVVKSTFVFCFSYVIGCVLSIGRIDRTKPMFGVGQATLRIYKTSFRMCSQKCGKRCNCKNQLGPVCLKSSLTSKAVILNSEFIKNKNCNGSAVYITHDSVQGRKGILVVIVSNTMFLGNSAGTRNGALQVKVVKPSSMIASLLVVSNTKFVENCGRALAIQGVQNVTVHKITCNGTKGLCLFYTLVRESKTSAIGLNATLSIDNSIFSGNLRSMMFKIIQAHFLSLTIRETEIIAHKRANLLVMKLGTNRRENEAIIAKVLFERVVFANNKIPKFILREKVNPKDRFSKRRKKREQPKNSFMFGFIIPKSHNGSIEVLFRKCVFKGNEQMSPNISNSEIPTMMLLRSPEDHEKPSNLQGKRKKPKFPSYIYVNSYIFERVIFENNIASTYFLYIFNANITFKNCLFKNNFSHKTKIGAHVYIEDGTASVTFQNSKFHQTLVNGTSRSELIQKDYILSMLFVFAGANGPLVLKNSSFMIDVSERMSPLFTIQTEGYVHLDNNTKLICPIGSYMSFTNASHVIYLGAGNGTAINSTNMKYVCKTCGVGKYSIQRGAMHGTRLVYIECFEFCPYGARCTNNIESKTNFWGYKTELNPPQLNFTRCPESYCYSPKTKYDVSAYNKCHGNRNGVMCGSCKEGFSENIFNHQCHSIKDCNDKWFWVIAGLNVVIMAYYILKQPPLVRYLIKKFYWFNIRQPGPGDDQNERELEHNHHHGHGYSKIIFYFYQVADLLMIDSAREILKKRVVLSTIVAFFNFEVELGSSSFGCPFPGLTVLTKELFRSSKVFAVMVVIVMFFLCSFLISFIFNKRRPSHSLYIAAIVEVLLLGYERLGHTSLELLNCTPLKINGLTEWRLFLDGNISCWVHWWQYALIAYNVIFIVPFLVVLLVGATKLRNQQIYPWIFVVACFVPLPFLIFWLFQFINNYIKHRNYSSLRGTDGDDDLAGCGNDNEMRHVLLEVLQGPFRKPDDKSKGASYWESILIGRRLVLLCITAFISTPMTKFLFMTAFCILALFHNTIVNPYHSNKANVFALLIHGMLVALATVNLCKSVLDTIGISAYGPLKLQIYKMKIFEVVVIGFLPGIFALLVVCVFISQAIRLMIFMCKWCKICLRQNCGVKNLAELNINVNDGNFNVNAED